MENKALERTKAGLVVSRCSCREKEFYNKIKILQKDRKAFFTTGNT